MSSIFFLTQKIYEEYHVEWWVVYNKYFITIFLKCTQIKCGHISFTPHNCGLDFTIYYHTILKTNK